MMWGRNREKMEGENVEKLVLYIVVEEDLILGNGANV